MFPEDEVKERDTLAEFEDTINGLIEGREEKDKDKPDEDSKEKGEEEK